MKLLIIANGSIVFGKELQEHLNSNSDKVFLLDFESLVINKPDNTQDKRYAQKFAKYKKLPKLSMFFRLVFIKKILHEGSFDIVNIHYSRWIYLFLLSALKKSKFIVTFYGSDFYRTTDTIKKIQRYLYKKADALSFTNPLTRESFLEYYKEFEDKCFVCRFGLGTLDFIDKNRDKDTAEIRNILGYGRKKIIVTCGYNSTKAQQHEKIIEALENLDAKYKSTCRFIFPLTYGDNIHKRFVKEKLKEVDFECLVLEEFLYEDENAYVKLASDVMINMLQTDSFSGSMQEFLYAKNIVITGSWLPYDVFDKAGIVYEKIEHTDELKDKLAYVLANRENFKDKLERNRDIIYELSSWKNTLGMWKKMYQLVEDKK
jgi:glycosyltransferase involved in cell wall biosynthesis